MCFVNELIVRFVEWVLPCILRDEGFPQPVWPTSGSRPEHKPVATRALSVNPKTVEFLFNYFYNYNYIYLKEE